ncbi:unnamed protein product [Ascophyllum nodosum]
MVVFNSKKQQEQERPLPLPLPPDVPLEAGATPLRVGGPGHTWYSSVRTAPPSSGTGKGSRTGTGSVGGAERYGYLSFSEVQVDDDELQQEEESDEMRSWGSYSSHADSFRSSREMLQRRLRKRARAWRVFLAVMQEHGLRVRKYHRRGKGWAHRVVKYDSSLPGLRWKSNKWWDAGGGQIPLRDVLDVERRSKVVWIKCLHLGTVGFEASLETDAVIFYLAMDSLLDRRCGVDDSSRERRLTGSMFA